MNILLRILALLILLVIFQLHSLEPKAFVILPIFSFREFNDSLVEITIKFNNTKTVGDFIVKQKNINSNYWEKIEKYPTETRFIIDTIKKSNPIEYGFKVASDTIEAFGYYIVGYEVEAPIYNGKALILVDSTIYPFIKDELHEFIIDLENDGWYAESRIVPRAEKFNPIEVRKVKRIVNSYKRRWAGDFKALLLVGRVAVPYTGNYSFDGHTEHFGAFPSDLVYLIDDTLLTDEVENNITASREENWNVPFDGKYDQITLPDSLKIALGRIDFSNLTFFKQSEIELTRSYFKKNRSFRYGEKQRNLNGLIDDGFGTQSEEIFSANAWMNFYSLCDTIVEGNYFENVSKEYFCFSYACNSGSYTSLWNSINSEQCANFNIHSTFIFLLGSYFWDWDVENNLLRSIVASSPDALLSAWIGRPFWHLHHLNFGYPFAKSFLATANNQNLYLSTSKYGQRGMHLEIIGDPTLRIYYPKPIANLKLSIQKPNLVSLEWEVFELVDNLLGYQILRKYPGGNYKTIATLSKDKRTYHDTLETSGKYQYQIRAIYKVKTKTGTVLVPSLGKSNLIEID